MRYLFCAIAWFSCCCMHYAEAAIELTSFSVTSHSADPGLVVHTSPASGPLPSSGPSPLVLVKDVPSGPIDLFKIWTNESSVGIGEDTVAKPIAININFVANGVNHVATVMGQTRGVAGFFLFVPYGAGSVDWESPADILFDSGVRLKIELLDQLFNANLGYGNLSPGESSGSHVKAIFTLLEEPAPPAVEPGQLSAPEPATVAVWAGLSVAAAIGGWRRRGLTA